MDLALNNLQWLICHKTKQNQTYPLDEGETAINKNKSVTQTSQYSRTG